MISAAAATGIFDAIVACGANPDQVLQSVGLDRAVLENRDAFVPCSSFSRLLEEAARASGDDCFGLHFGERFNPRDIGALTYVVINSPTVGVAIRNIQRYIHIHNQAARVSCTTDGAQTYLRALPTDAPAGSRRQHNEFSMAVTVRILRLMTGHQWSPREIQLVHEAPAQLGEHRRVFGCPVKFGCLTNAVVLEHNLLDQLVPTADDRLYRVVKQLVQRILTEMPHESDVLADVRMAIANCLQHGDASLDAVVKHLGIGRRTLQRRLSESGTTFKALLDDTRRRFAIQYVQHGKHAFTEVTLLLGYSEVSAFNRAFKRWTGLAPLDYRAKATQQPR